MEKDNEQTLDKRQSRYVEPEIQFALIGGLIFTTTIESLFVGWGFHEAIRIAQNWRDQRQVAEFFAVVALTLILLVAVDFWLGTWFSQKLAGPIRRIRQAAAEWKRGNIGHEIQVRESDFLQGAVEDINSSLRSVKSQIERDRSQAQSADLILSRCRDWAARQELPDSSKEEFRLLIAQAKAHLSIIGVHFTKWKERSAP